MAIMLSTIPRTRWTLAAPQAPKGQPSDADASATQTVGQTSLSKTGRLLPASFHCEVPANRVKEAQASAAIDYAFANNRFSGTVEYYQKNTEDLLLTVSVPQPALADSVKDLKKARSTTRTGCGRTPASPESSPRCCRCSSRSSTTGA